MVAPLVLLLYGMHDHLISYIYVRKNNGVGKWMHLIIKLLEFLL